MPRQELVNIIRNNIWDGEIDVERATIQQLSDFVANKERIMRERSERPAARQQEATQPTNNGGVNEFIQMLQNMAEEAQNNPALMDAIQRFMPRK